MMYENNKNRRPKKHTNPAIPGETENSDNSEKNEFNVEDSTEKNTRLPVDSDKTEESENTEDAELIPLEVEFKGMRKGYYWCDKQDSYHPGDWVIVEAERGEDIGVISLKGLSVFQRKNNYIKKKMKIIRPATKEDLSKSDLNRRDEKEALRICRERVVARNLKMKLVDSEYQLDRNKITFYFTAQKRVDFRELVKDLAGIFKTRIEMRQIGVRDEARWLKGYGSCGRPLCCSSYINKFEPVTLKMAKDQLLSLNPTKLSGVCGRLMCCLSYERDFYRSELKKYPYLGMKVEYAGKRGRVSKYNVFKELIYIQFTDGSEEKVPLEKMNKEILPLKSSSNWVVDEYEEFDDFEDHEI